MPSGIFKWFNYGTVFCQSWEKYDPIPTEFKCQVSFLTMIQHHLVITKTSMADAAGTQRQSCRVPDFIKLLYSRSQCWRAGVQRGAGSVYAWWGVQRQAEELMESILSYLGVRGLKAIPSLMPLQSCAMGKELFSLLSSKQMEIRAGPVGALFFISDIISP